MNRTQETIIWLCLLLLAVIAGGVAGSQLQKRHDRVAIKTKTDTITYYVDKPAFRPSLASEIKLDVPPAIRFYVATFTDTLGRVDSVVVRDTLEKTQKYYEDEDCKVWASGYDVAVDSVQVRERVREIKNTNYVNVPSVRQWALYGKADAMYDGVGRMSAGVGLEFRPASWAHLYAEGGYGIHFNGQSGAYGEIGVRVDVIRFGKYGRK